MRQLLLGLLTGGGSFLLSALGTVLPGLATSIGDIFIKAKQTQAAREAKQDEAGAGLANHWIVGVTEANRARVEARKNEGAWGPLGIVTFVIGMFLATHVGAVVADSLPLLPHLTTTLWIVPWVELSPHTPCRCVAALPDKFQEVELAAIQALFYTAPPAAAAVAVAKVFRR